MLEFQSIIEQIAKAMNITTDLAKQLIENFPSLVKEYQIYYSLKHIVGFTNIVTIISFTILFVLMAIIFINNFDEYEEKKVKVPYLKTQIAILLVAILVNIFSKIGMVIFAPNMHIIINQITNR